MARQGQAFAIVDVPKDGKTVGEVVTAGNIVMKEVKKFNACFSILISNVVSILTIRKRQRKHSEEVLSELATWLSGTLTERSL